MREGHPQRGWPSRKNVRRRPTLPQPLGCSTIGAERLDFRVRDGTGYFPLAKAAVTLAGRLTGYSREQPKLLCLCCKGGIQLYGFLHVWTRAVSAAAGKSDNHVLSWLNVCGTSPRSISTSRLGITAVHLWPINPVFCWGPYLLM